MAGADARAGARAWRGGFAIAAYCSCSPDMAPEAMSSLCTTQLLNGWVYGMLGEVGLQCAAQVQGSEKERKGTRSAKLTTFRRLLAPCITGGRWAAAWAERVQGAALAWGAASSPTHGGGKEGGTRTNRVAPELQPTIESAHARR